MSHAGCTCMVCVCKNNRKFKWYSLIIWKKLFAKVFHGNWKSQVGLFYIDVKLSHPVVPETVSFAPKFWNHLVLSLIVYFCNTWTIWFSLFLLQTLVSLSFKLTSRKLSYDILLFVVMRFRKKVFHRLFARGSPLHPTFDNFFFLPFLSSGSRRGIRAGGTRTAVVLRGKFDWLPDLPSNIE